MALVTISTTPVAVLCAVIIIIQAKKYTDRQQKEVGELNAYMDRKNLWDKKRLSLKGFKQMQLKALKYVMIKYVKQPLLLKRGQV